MPRASFVLALALTACAGSATDQTFKTFKDQGEICAFPEGASTDTFAPQMEVSFPADKSLVITVQSPGCLSSSCDQDRQATCTATVSGQVIVVTSSASYRHEGSTCTLDCGALIAKCTTPPLPAGTYLIQHGQDSMPLTISSRIVPPCTGPAL